MKTCTKCEVAKEETAFPKTRSTCRECRKKYNSKYYRTNPEYFKQAQQARRKANPNADRDYARARRIRIPDYYREFEKRHPGRHLKAMLKRKYGLSIEAWDEMMLAQGGMCAICNNEAKLCVDHDHMSGKVRGLLCSLCNQALGLLRDSSAVTQLATEYLKQHGK